MDRLQDVVNQQIHELLSEKLRLAVENLDINKLVIDYVLAKITDKQFQQYVDRQIKSAVDRTEITEIVKRNLDQRGQQFLNSQKPRIEQLVRDRTDAVIVDSVKQIVNNIQFPVESIPTSSIDWKDFTIDHTRVKGLPKHNGVEDFAKQVELTILDGNVVVENKITTRVIEANSIKTKNFEVSDVFKNQITDYVLGRIPAPKIDTDEFDRKIERLQTFVEDRVKRTGQMQELEVSGEAMLSDTLYTTPGNNRVGINTMDPSDALTVWDQETEIVIGKHSSQQGYIGSRRRQAVNIGSNNHVGITVKPDGTVQIDKLQLGNRTIGFSKTIPNTSMKRGDIVFNDDVAPGKPVGWICLDGIRWSGFGKIE